MQFIAVASKLARVKKLTFLLLVSLVLFTLALLLVRLTLAISMVRAAPRYTL